MMKIIEDYYLEQFTTSEAYLGDVHKAAPSNLQETDCLKASSLLGAGL